MISECISDQKVVKSWQEVGIAAGLSNIRTDRLFYLEWQAPAASS